MTAARGREPQAPLTADRLGVDVTAGRTFSAEQRQMLERMVVAIGRDLQIAEHHLGDAFAALRLASLGTVVVLEPAGPGVPSLFLAGGVAVRYNGKVSADLRQCLKTMHRHLRLLPGEAQLTPAPHPEATTPRPDAVAEPQAAPDRPIVPLMALNGSLPLLPHDPAVRRIAELLWKPCPTIKLGHACNVSCVYCCAGSDGPRSQSDETLRGMVDALRGAGYRGIGYMGGEPTIHAGLLGLVRHASELGFETQVLVTNGIRLGDGAYAARTIEAGINVVILSLDAFDAEVQERLFGGRTGYARSLAGLHNVLAAPGVQVVLAAVVTALNADLLPRYMEEVAALQQQYGKPIGVLLHALQAPAETGPEQRALHLDLPEAARLVGVALSRARELGVATLSFSIPSCLLEGYEQNVVDLYATEWEVDLATGVAVRSARRGAQTYWTTCATCPHIRYCAGVLTQYADDATKTIVAARTHRSTAKRS